MLGEDQGRQRDWSRRIHDGLAIEKGSGGWEGAAEGGVADRNGQADTM